MTVQFNPGSWDAAAGAFSEASGVIAGIQAPGPVGGGPTQVDAAVAQLAAQLQSAVAGVAAGMAAGLNADATSMRSAAAAYRAQEANNARAGSKSGGKG